MKACDMCVVANEDFDHPLIFKQSVDVLSPFCVKYFTLYQFYIFVVYSFPLATSKELFKDQKLPLIGVCATKNSQNYIINLIVLLKMRLFEVTKQSHFPINQCHLSHN